MNKKEVEKKVKEIQKYCDSSLIILFNSKDKLDYFGVNGHGADMAATFIKAFKNKDLYEIVKSAFVMQETIFNQRQNK